MGAKGGCLCELGWRWWRPLRGAASTRHHRARHGSHSMGGSHSQSVVHQGRQRNRYRAEPEQRDGAARSSDMVGRGAEGCTRRSQSGGWVPTTRTRPTSQLPLELRVHRDRRVQHFRHGTTGLGVVGGCLERLLVGAGNLRAHVEMDGRDRESSICLIQ